MPSPRWFVPRGNALKWRRWNESFVVFNPASGDTHYLNAIAGSVLKLLETEPASVEQIVTHLEAISGEPLDGELREQINGLVERFDAVGLIEPVKT